ncbi:MAG: pyridoxamine 5'-phosphate oxidase family protein [Actinobacteria bacterium]|nr:pyridoxamine 5'-phosphate oxidase family protein [Actinomycetota bacterium]
MTTATVPAPPDLVPTSRTTLKRRAARGRFERAAIHAVLDEGLVCHVAFVADGSPVVIPTAYARLGDAIYLHGSSGNRMLRSLLSGAPACITVTLVDGLVLARSAFHHSMNYRSVVIFGKGEKVTDPDEHARALAAVVEHIVPGRSSFVRPPNREEILQTLVVRFPVSEASMKERMGGPLDDEPDYDLDVWAGYIPLTMVPGSPVDDPLRPPRSEVPEHAVRYRRPSAGN